MSPGTPPCCAYGNASLAVGAALRVALALRAFDLEGFTSVIAIAVAVWLEGRGLGVLTLPSARPAFGAA